MMIPIVLMSGRDRSAILSAILRPTKFVIKETISGGWFVLHPCSMPDERSTITDNNTLLELFNRVIDIRQKLHS